MKALLTVALAALLASCGTGRKRVANLPAPRPPEAQAVEPRDRGQQEIDNDREDQPGEAVDFYLLKRTGGAPLSLEPLFAARRHAAGMRLYSLASRRFVPRRAQRETPRDASLGTWQPVGPGNVGGRTRGFVIRPDDPNTLYAGAVSGGVWKTTDGGKTWNPLTDLLPSIGIGALAMDPTAPDTLYAGTGEWFTDSQRGDSVRGAGIFKTTDGGATWTQLPSTASSFFYYVNKIVVSPANSQHVYAATYGGIAYSPDAGATWRLQLDRSGTDFGCQDLAIRTDQAADYLFAACASLTATNPGIYRNTDASGAGTWQMIFNPPNLARTSLALAPSQQSTIYAAASSSEKGNFSSGLLGVFRSDSNGDAGTWVTQTSNQDPIPLNTVLFSNPTPFFADVCTKGTRTFANQGDYDNVIAVDPLNSEIVWVGGIDVFRSDDGGKNWGIAAFWDAEPPQLAHADNHVLAFAPGYNGADNQTLFVASDGGIYRTDNALASTATGARAACAPYPTSVVWNNVNNGYAVTQFYHGSVYPGGAAYIGGTQDNGTRRGSDAAGLADWPSPIPGDGGFTAIDPTNPNTWYGETTHLNFRKTTNGGNTFTTSIKGITEPDANFLFIAPFVMDPSQPNRLYLGGSTLWRTSDGAQNWSEAASAVPAANGSISAIAVSPADPNHVVFGTSNGFLYRNTAATASDKTAVWPSTQPRSGYVSGVTFDPADPGVVYATYSQYKTNAAQSHVYRSTDGGATWTGIDGAGATGLPDVPVFSIAPDPQNPSNLYLAGDIGVFVSLDGGATWSRDDNPFADAVTEKLVLDRSAGQTTLVAFTHGRGIWKTVLPGSGAPCQYALSGASTSFPAAGGTATINVSTGAGCAWSAVPDGSAFTIGSPAGGQGNGSFTVTAARKDTAQASAVNISVQDKLIAVAQEGALAASGNDDVSSPFPAGTLPAVVFEQNNSATESPGDPVHSCTSFTDFNTLWFSVTAPADGLLQLGFLSARLDTGADSGTVLTAYRLVAGAPGPELTCMVSPQTPNFITTRFPQVAVKQGDTILVEVSATTSGSPAGASLQPGRITLLPLMR